MTLNAISSVVVRTCIWSGSLHRTEEEEQNPMFCIILVCTWVLRDHNRTNQAKKNITQIFHSMLLKWQDLGRRGCQRVKTSHVYWWICNRLQTLWSLYLLTWDFLLSQINTWTTTTWSNVWVVLPKPSWYEFLIGFLIWTPASKYLHLTIFSKICVI